MKYMTHDEIRNKWFEFFEKKGHKKCESAPLVPYDDDSVLWINAGVTPLKKYFDGSEVPESNRLVNIQKCIRTNDIENVGITKRHQTFFEMMGNFSIGDYFKKEAIEYSYELLTSEEYFGIPKEKLYVTIYSEDLEAKSLWEKVGIDKDHIIPLKDNFWEIGNGPCGPDSEIFYDRGEKYDKEGNALELFKQDEEQERFVEIWNNVFSQYNSEEGKARSEYKELPRKNIDTGAGLERWCCIMQDVDSNFETDLFTKILRHISELANSDYNGEKEYKIIADHIRAITFALADGASFENVGRGYVLRRLLRRSVRYGKQMGIKPPFMYKLVSDVVETMENAYPYLVDQMSNVGVEVLEEEKLFLKTLEEGERRLKELVENSSDGFISGEDAFKLYDTYGFPFELTQEYLEELGYKVNKEEFDKYMNSQKELSKQNAKNITSMASQKEVLLNFKKESQFVYGLYRVRSNIIAIFSHDEEVERIDHDTYIATSRTCFYAESGGQVSDTGMIIGKNFKARVLDVFKGPNGQHIHKVKLLDGYITKGDNCELIVDRDRRRRIEANHSTVHILQYALQQVISDKIKQAGSYVDQDKLRFDFTYPGKLNDDQIINVEAFANKMIKENIIVSTEIMPIEKAKEIGAMALFSEKYGDIVRVVKIGKSIELCGGTHVSNTNEIDAMAIMNYESKGSNIYRIEATTNNIPDRLLSITKPYNDELLKLLIKSKEILEDSEKKDYNLELDVEIENIQPHSFKDIIFLRNQLQYVHHEVKELESKYKDYILAESLNNLEEYLDKTKEINGINTIILKTNNIDNNILKSLADELTNQLKDSFIFFANIKEDKSVNFIAKSNSKINAGYIVKEASQRSDGNGGGSPTFAQGGGKHINNIDEIFKHIEEVINNNE